eukprot:SAG22_NODE_2_length_61565_cov_858.782010_23_plen_74_part_00
MNNLFSKLSSLLLLNLPQMHMVEMSKNMSLSATASKQGEGLLPKQYYRIVESSSQATHEEKDSEDNNKKCPHV